MKTSRASRAKLLAMAAALTVVSAWTVTASPAQAASGPHYWMYTDELNPFGKGGRVDFWPVGDIVQVCDRIADGTGVTVEVGDNTGGFFKYDLEASGAGVCKTARARDGSWANLAEGHCLRFTIYLWNNTSSRDQAQWRNYNDAKVNC